MTLQCSKFCITLPPAKPGTSVRGTLALVGLHLEDAEVWTYNTSALVSLCFPWRTWGSHIYFNFNVYTILPTLTHVEPNEQCSHAYLPVPPANNPPLPPLPIIHCSVSNLLTIQHCWSIWSTITCHNGAISVYSESYNKTRTFGRDQRMMLRIWGIWAHLHVRHGVGICILRSVSVELLNALRGTQLTN